MFMKNVERHRIGTSEDNVPITDKVAAIIRSRDDLEGDLRKMLLDWNQFKVKMIGNEYVHSSIMQRYIKSPGGRPTVTRLYYTPYQKGNKANYAYFLTSKHVGAELKSIQKCVVDTSNPEFIDVFTKSGAALKPFESEANKIVQHLNRGYNIRIEEIILDFLTDDKGVVWLIGCKSIKVDKNTLTTCLQPVRDWWPEQKLSYYSKAPAEKAKELQEEKKKGLMSFVHCKLCRLYYQNNELAHLVSVRMLMLYKVHVSRRMDLTWDTSHLKITSSTMLSQSVRVCQYCYMLVTSEFELIKIEEQLARILGVPYAELGYEEDPRLTVQLQFLPKQLTQWRIFLLCTKIFDYQKLPKSFYLHFNFSGHITTFYINNLPITNEYEPYIPLSIARMHYLFSSPEKSIKSFLSMFIFEMRITHKEKFEEKVIAATKGKILSDLPSNMPYGNALYQKKQMLFFNESNETMCNLSINVGISCDKLIPSKKIKVMMNKQKDTYIPESQFMTTDPLPQEWLELLGYENPDETAFGPQIDEEKFYCPQMTRTEMMRMEDMTSPYKKFHSDSYNHITSRILRPATARLPEVMSAKDIKKPKGYTQKLELDQLIEEVPEEVAPFYRVVNDYLKTRPVTAIASGTKKKRTTIKANDTKSSVNNGNLESLSTLFSPKGANLTSDHGH
ncbi:hypothetical protein SteCoe_23177 [Stentor coeruleus]|uniref:Uncharacterized protein n=1 Tax=Stentor coeruleus TaxID=5963 RepID=A0A1R2BGX9_9CILI|nr:hypothetical protein SteCoe_24709 [Stentor coeruleus]OMJ77268.1 hypothetical protein SteCoe_23177 [Stentor coeruleus]